MKAEYKANTMNNILGGIGNSIINSNRCSSFQKSRTIKKMRKVDSDSSLQTESITEDSEDYEVYNTLKMSGWNKVKMNLGRILSLRKKQLSQKGI